MFAGFGTIALIKAICQIKGGKSVLMTLVTLGISHYIPLPRSVWVIIGVLLTTNGGM
jgi:hypothetical protein